jgi:hypothetical protein
LREIERAGSHEQRCRDEQHPRPCCQHRFHCGLPSFISLLISTQIDKTTQLMFQAGLRPNPGNIARRTTHRVALTIQYAAFRNSPAILRHMTGPENQINLNSTFCIYPRFWK